jgi:hypothetical protein
MSPPYTLVDKGEHIGSRRCESCRCVHLQVVFHQTGPRSLQTRLFEDLVLGDRGAFDQ